MKNVLGVYNLTDHQCGLLGKFIFWDVEVQRCGAFSYTAGNIVVRTMARAEPPSVITCLTDRHASQVCADT